MEVPEREGEAEEDRDTVLLLLPQALGEEVGVADRHCVAVALGLGLEDPVDLPDAEAPPLAVSAGLPLAAPTAAVDVMVLVAQRLLVRWGEGVRLAAATPREGVGACVTLREMVEETVEEVEALAQALGVGKRAVGEAVTLGLALSVC